MVSFLYDIVVQPIVMLIELTFGVFHGLTSSPGVAIVGVSVVVNLLCLPLYRMADDQQERELARQRGMERWVSHIKEHFRGDEQYMMLTAYYAEQGYRPVQALVGSLSLLLQIPFFMAAYNYLSHLRVLEGASFGPLADLGAPDALLSLGGATLNLLPVLMTLLNCASTLLYTRGRPLRDKAQAYLLAGLFLFLLYDSPSGLVFYWTCNQLFSLLKNVFMKVLARPRRWALAIEQAAACGAFGFLIASGRLSNLRTLVFLGAGLLLFEVLWARAALRERRGSAEPEDTSREGAGDGQVASRFATAEFFLAAGVLAVLLGLLIPSSLVADSPTEFMSAFFPENPMSPLVHGALMWAGMFVLWAGTYFVLSRGEGREAFSLGMVCLAGAALVDYFGFGKGMGTLSSMLIFDNPLAFPWPVQLLNFAAIGVVVAVVLALRRFKRELLRPVLGILLVALGALCVPNALAINAGYDATVDNARIMADKLYEQDGGLKRVFPLSKTERNVVVLFLDRALSLQFPFMLQERPEIMQDYDGFVYYPNTIAFGSHTNYGSPPIYGGYEYTPTEMNARPDESLKDKHNEALKLMPTLFSQAGYETVVVDPPYANYEFVPDVSIFDGMQGVSAYHMSGAYSGLMEERYGITTFMAGAADYCRYSLLKALPDSFKEYYYAGGSYLVPHGSILPPGPVQIGEYATLDVLTDISETREGEGTGTFLLIANGLPHEPWPLQLPDYHLSPVIDNDGLEDMSRFTLNGKTLDMDARWTALPSYHSNMATHRLVGDWLDWMRAEGVYDNTRIIIVADHGYGLMQYPELTLEGGYAIEECIPLLLVKDFDAHGFSTSDEFMTNADVPTIAMNGIIDDPVNPATGKHVDSSEKTAHDQVVTSSHNWGVDVNNGNTFETGDTPWYSVHDDIFDLDNWQRVG